MRFVHIGSVSLPGCCELEAKPPPLELSTPGRGGCREVIAFLAPFRHRPFHCMFWFLFLQSIANIVATYFTQCAQHDSLSPLLLCPSDSCCSLWRLLLR